MKKHSDERLPLPSHLDVNELTLAAGENFDHNDDESMSGKKSSHDTVTVLFQKKREVSVLKKERVSEMSPLPSMARTNGLLECQKTIPYFYNKVEGKKQPLPSNFIATANQHYEDDPREKILSLVRNTSAPEKDELQMM